MPPARGAPAQGPVLVVDDHPLVAVALVTAWQRQGLSAEQLPPDQPSALDDALSRDAPGVLVLDLDLGGTRDGVELIPVACLSGWTVVIFTGTTDRGRLARAIAAGAVGWVSKSQPFEQVVATIDAVAGGEPVFDPGLRAELVAEHRQRTREQGHLDELWARLTRREREVLERLAEGKRATGIAEEFVVSVATVRSQIRSILAKLEVSSQLEAVALARRRH
ncbi:MAG: LuxR C-terminal-related transcriptional regulator [Pseudonocardiaceae bacterium]